MCARNHAILLDVGRGLDETERRIAAALMASPRASLLRDLPATADVRSWDAYDLMKVFPAGFAWSAGLLTTEQFSSLAPILREPRDAPGIGPLDDELIGQLAADARASYRDLAARLATSASTVRRRLDLLESAHMLRLACDVDLGLLGIHADALLWIATGPGRLEATGHQLSRHPQVRFAAATTGAANLLVAVAAEDLGGLYVFLTETVGSIDDVRGLEVTRILSSVKRTGLIRPSEI